MIFLVKITSSNINSLILPVFHLLSFQVEKCIYALSIISFIDLCGTLDFNNFIHNNNMYLIKIPTKKPLDK